MSSVPLPCLNKDSIIYWKTNSMFHKIISSSKHYLLPKIFAKFNQNNSDSKCLATQLQMNTDSKPLL